LIIWWDWNFKVGVLIECWFRFCEFIFRWLHTHKKWLTHLTSFYMLWAPIFVSSKKPKSWKRVASKRSQPLNFYYYIYGQKTPFPWWENISPSHAKCHYNWSLKENPIIFIRPSNHVRAKQHASRDYELDFDMFELGQLELIWF